MATWISLGPAPTITATSATQANTTTILTILGGFYGAQFFMQLTANDPSLGVKAFGFDIH